MTRRYDMQRRRAEAARTRSAILDAAAELLDARQATGLTLDEVARAAGVSRATIYNQFGSRPGLLAAVFEDTGRRIGYERVRTAQALPDAREALVETVLELGRAWSVKRLALRRTHALAVLDEEVGALVARYEAYRRTELGGFVKRLADAGLLGAGLGVEEATALLAPLTGPEFFDALRGRGSVRQATLRLLKVITTTLGIEIEAPHDGTNRR